MHRFLRSFGHAVDGLDRLIIAVCALLLATVVFLTGGEIVARTLFGRSSIAMVDLALQFAIVMYFIGYASLLNRNQDITMDYFYVRLPVRVRRAVDIATGIAIVGFFLLLTVKAIALFRLGLRFPHPVFPVPNAIVILPAILGAAGGLLVAVRKALDTIFLQSGSTD